MHDAEHLFINPFKPSAVRKEVIRIPRLHSAHIQSALMVDKMNIKSETRVDTQYRYSVRSRRSMVLKIKASAKRIWADNEKSGAVIDTMLIDFASLDFHAFLDEAE